MEKEVKYETYKTFLVKFAYYAVWAAGIYFVIKLLGSVLLPFFLAFLLAWILKYPTDFLSRKTKIKRKASALIVIFLFFIIIGVSCYLLGKSLCDMIFTAWDDLSVFFSNTVVPVLNSFSDWCHNLGNMGDGRAIVNAEDFISEMSGSVISNVSGMAACIPAVCMNILVIAIELIFLELEFPAILEWLLKWMPKKWIKYIENGQQKAGGMFKKYAASYVFIFFMTFFELWIGLLLLHVGRSFQTALFIAVLDILPVLGTGTILLPWGIYLVCCGDKSLGIGILLMYLFITIVRNYVEPRLVGKQMGLSPAVTLPGILIGYQLFGLLGVFLLPVGAMIFQCMNGKERK